MIYHAGKLCKLMEDRKRIPAACGNGACQPHFCSSSSSSFTFCYFFHPLCSLNAFVRFYGTTYRFVSLTPDGFIHPSDLFFLSTSSHNAVINLFLRTVISSSFFFSENSLLLFVYLFPVSRTILDRFEFTRIRFDDIWIGSGNNETDSDRTEFIILSYFVFRAPDSFNI